MKNSNDWWKAKKISGFKNTANAVNLFLNLFYPSVNSSTSATLFGGGLGEFFGVDGGYFSVAKRANVRQVLA